MNDTALDGKGLLVEHGLSIWIETQGVTALLDSGETGKVLMHNLEALKLNPMDIQAVVISHSHIDHTGGLAALLQKNANMKVFAHPDIFRERFSRRKGKYESVGLPQGLAALSIDSRLSLSDQPMEVLPGIWTTGEIISRPEFEGRSANHFIRGDHDWLPDLYRDDMSLVIKTERGLHLVCGCCHAGLLNTLLQVRSVFGGPMISVTGGMHLLTAGKPELDQVIRFCEEMPEIKFYPNHCTGNDAVNMLADAFKDRVWPFHTGCEMIINEE